MGGMTICGPDPKCADPHPHRWYCMRGHALDDGPGTPGVCPLTVCDRRGANRAKEDACHCGANKPASERFCAACDPWCEPGAPCKRPTPPPVSHGANEVGE